MWIKKEIYEQLLALLDRPYLYDIEQVDDRVTFHFIKDKNVYSFTMRSDANIQRIIN